MPLGRLEPRSELFDINLVDAVQQAERQGSWRSSTGATTA